MNLCFSPNEIKAKIREGIGTIVVPFVELRAEDGQTWPLNQMKLITISLMEITTPNDLDAGVRRYVPGEIIFY